MTEPIRSTLLRPRDCSFLPGDWEILASHWFPVARTTDVSSQPIAARLLDLPLVVYRTPTAVHVARDLCPHRGVPLSMGWVEGDELVCRYHGLRYGPDGRCRRIPAQPDARPTGRLSLTVFPALERYGLIWTCLAAEGEPRIPPMPAWDDPHFQAILPPPVDIAGAPGRQLEGFIDVAHFAFVHDTAFADRDNPTVPTYDTTETDDGLRTEYWSDVSNYPKALQHLAPPGFRWLRVYDIYPPFTAQLTVHFPDNGLLHILNAASPVSARRTRLFVPIARNFDTTGDVEDVYLFNAQVFDEDRIIVESQTPEDLPLDMQSEAHFAADRSSVYYRRRLKSMGLQLAYAR